jgi:hypothetical protein
MFRRIPRLVLVALSLLVAFSGFAGWGLITRALQAVDIFSPASGHAQVIAQGVAEAPEEAAWRVVFHSVAPGETSSMQLVGPGFLLADTGGVLVGEPGQESLLAPSEAIFRPTGEIGSTAVGNRAAGVFTIDLVPPSVIDQASSGIPVFASAPFAVPAGARDIDLVRDRLDPGESTTVIGGEFPVMVLATLGEIQIEATDGSAALLRVGEGATASGDVVLTASGQAPATFVAAVIGRAAPVPGESTPGSTPQPSVSGSVQVTVFACPPLVNPGDASSGSCLRDPEAVALDLASLEAPAPDVGPSTERDGLPTWTALPAGNYALTATEFKDGFGRFLVPGLSGVDGGGQDGFGVGDGGFVVPISADTPDQKLEVFVFIPRDGSTTESPISPTPAPVASPSPAATESVIAIEGDSTETIEEPTPPGPTEIPSVIQVETPVPGTPTPTPRPGPTATPRPNPIAQSTAEPTERPIVTSTAVAQARRGAVSVRVWGCPSDIGSFDPARCGQAVEGFDIRLINADGEVIGLQDAEIASDGTVTWRDLPLGTYLFQQPVMLSGAVTYYAPNLQLANNGAGYLVAIGEDQPVAEVDVFSLPPAPTPPPPTLSPVAVDTDGDGISDADEIGVVGTDPNNADTDFDGVFDGAELGAETDPLVADAAATSQGVDGDSDGDRLLDADEAAYGTDPSIADSDGDSWFDGDEVSIGTDPLDASSFPVG